MQDRTDFPIEDYERHMPRLRKRRDRAVYVALGHFAAAFSQIGLFALTNNELSIWAAGGLTMAGWVWALVSKNAGAQHDLIRRGGRPTGVWFKLIEESKGDPDPLQNELRADMEHVVAVAERKALTDTESQWWRQEGSLWYETQQFINAAQSVIETHEEAARQAAREERRRAYEQDIAEAKARLQKAETERRIAATQRWIDEQREWDAFKEDAQIDAHERKERGDWYEPPMGIPGAIQEVPTAAQQREIVEATKRSIEGILDSYRVPLWSPSETHEVRIWGSPKPVAVFREDEGMPRCPRTGKSMYNRRQIGIIIQSLDQAGVGKHYSFSECGPHWHLDRKVR